MIGVRKPVRIVLAVIAVVLYAAMWIGYRAGWAWLDAVDYSVAHPGWVTFWDVFCTVLGPGGFRVVGVVVILVALRQRNVRAALFILFSVELSFVVTQTAKVLANRPRPAGQLVDAMGTSFPSGHALGVMAAVLALYAVLSPPVFARAWGILGAAVVLAIGCGRVLLNVHHPSDVLAGWALGYLYFMWCWWAFRPSPMLREAADIPAEPDSAR